MALERRHQHSLVAPGSSRSNWIPECPLIWDQATPSLQLVRVGLHSLQSLARPLSSANTGPLVAMEPTKAAIDVSSRRCSPNFLALLFTLCHCHYTLHYRSWSSMKPAAVKHWGCSEIARLCVTKSVTQRQTVRLGSTVWAAEGF